MTRAHCQPWLCHEARTALESRYLGCESRGWALECFRGRGRDIGPLRQLARREGREPDAALRNTVEQPGVPTTPEVA
jgi:hypothetical protein